MQQCQHEKSQFCTVPGSPSNLIKQGLLTVRSTKVPRELILVTEKWRQIFPSALRTCMHCLCGGVQIRKTRTIVTKERQIQEKDHTIATREKQLQEKDRTIVTRERQLQQKDHIIGTNERQHQEKDCTIATREIQLQEKDDAIATGQ